MQSNIQKFFSNNNNYAKDKEFVDKPQKRNNKGVPVATTVRTVQKWMKEYNTDLSYKTVDTESDVVTEFACIPCQNFSTDRTSSVSVFDLILGPVTSCWKVCSYLPMPGGLQCCCHLGLDMHLC